MGAVGVAIGLKAVFGDFEPTWAAKLVAGPFLLATIVIFRAARRQAHGTYNRLAQARRRSTTIALSHRAGHHHDAGHCPDGRDFMEPLILA